MANGKCQVAGCQTRGTVSRKIPFLTVHFSEQDVPNVRTQQKTLRLCRIHNRLIEKMRKEE